MQRKNEKNETELTEHGVLDVGGVSIRGPAYPPEAGVAGEEEALGLVDEDAGRRGRRQGEPVVGADGHDPQEDAEADGHGARQQHAPLEHDLLVDGLHAALHARRTAARAALGLGVLGHGFSCTAGDTHVGVVRSTSRHPLRRPSAPRLLAPPPLARWLSQAETDRPRAAR
jgi:hypothetical protein